MTDDKSRAAFEAWWDSSFVGCSNSGPWEPDTPIQWAWDAWQAALSHGERETARKALTMAEEAMGLRELERNIRAAFPHAFEEGGNG